MRISFQILALAGLFTISALATPAVTTDSKPLPSTDELIARVLERSQKESVNDQSFRQRYQYTRSKNTEYRNGSGELRKRSAKTSVNTPDAARATPTIATVKGGTLAATGNATNATNFDKKDLLADTNIISRFQFTIAGRETIAGRPTLVVDFQPKNKKLPEPTIKDRFFNKAAGRVWVDEAEAVLVKANLHLSEKVSLVGGLVGAVNKFTFSFNRERTPEGLWFTPLTTWHVEYREVILNRVIDFEEKKTNVKRAW